MCALRRSIGRDVHGGAKLENVVLIATVTLALVLPFSAFGRISSSRFVPADSDEARLIVPHTPQASEAGETSEAQGWKYFAARTLSRLIWLAAENFIVTRELGRWHAERTGQVDSYETFVASARSNIRESWEGLRAMVETLPAQVIEDPSKVPMLASALVVGAIGGVLYPFQFASALVFGNDEEAGAVAGGFIIDAWMTKALAGAGVGTRALKTQRVARIWRRVLQTGDELATAFFPMQRVTANAAHTLQMRIRTVDRSRVAAAKLPKSTKVSPEERLQRLRQSLPADELHPSMLEVAAESPTLVKNVVAAARRGPLPQRDWTGRSWPEPTLLRDGEPAAPVRGAATELGRLARLATIVGAERQPVAHLRTVSTVPLNEYMARTLPNLVRRTGEGIMGRIEVRDELRRMQRPPQHLDTAFTVSPAMETAYRAFQTHGNRRLAQEELGLLYMQQGFGARGEWQMLQAQLERVETFYINARTRDNAYARLSGAADRHPLYDYRAFFESHLDVVRRTRERLVPNSAQAAPSSARLDAAEPQNVLRLLKVSPQTSERGARSPKLIEDVRAFVTNGRVDEASVLGRPTPWRNADTVSAEGERYGRLAIVAREAGTARIALREPSFERRMSLDDYLGVVLPRARASRGEGVLRQLEVRDELLAALPDDAREIRAAFGTYGESAEDIYRRFSSGEIDRASAQDALGHLYLDEQRHVSGRDLAEQWQHAYGIRYLERVEEMEFWGWWKP